MPWNCFGWHGSMLTRILFPGYSKPYLIYYRMVYTLLFFCLITTILMNIIFGVIIDTFAELRAKKEQIDLDMSGAWNYSISVFLQCWPQQKSVLLVSFYFKFCKKILPGRCFICGLDRFIFDEVCNTLNFILLFSFQSSIFICRLEGRLEMDFNIILLMIIIFGSIFSSW